MKYSELVKLFLIITGAVIIGMTIFITGWNAYSQSEEKRLETELYLLCIDKAEGVEPFYLACMDGYDYYELSDYKKRYYMQLAGYG